MEPTYQPLALADTSLRNRTDGTRWEDGLIKTTHPLPACPHILQSRGRKKNREPLAAEKIKNTYLILKCVYGFWVN